jgi:predicted RNase H-like HicB family nuclease
VIEKGERNYSARSGLPGCVSVGDALEDVKAEIREAIELHLEGMWQDGLPIPKPSSRAEYVEVDEGARKCASAWRNNHIGMQNVGRLKSKIS